MPASCQIAFKEWAAVCEALASGRQAIILRKGGIQETGGAFTPEHAAFWLYPTNFHQAAESLTADAAEFVDRAARAQPKPGMVALQHLAVVHEVRQLTTEQAALSLAGSHIWSDATIRQRFHYRRPGLFLLVVRVYSSANVAQVQESPEMAGCKSWVELPDELATSGLSPVLTDDAFASVAEAIRRALHL
jgi:hypothetical protein